MARWRFEHREMGHTVTAERMDLYWEVAHDPISDDYTPTEISAKELFDLWAQSVRKEKRFKTGLIPVYWFVDVEGPNVKTFEQVPYQFVHLPQYEVSSRNFFTFFTWPENTETGELLNWLTLPVVDKLWGGRRADKGGFIQAATDWKPAALQPFVFLPALERALHRGY